MSGGGGGESGEPDLTAMLDLVFQLITFFMLVINFKAAAMDLELKLPVVGSAKPVDEQGSQDMLVLNVNKKGELRVFGTVQKDIPHYLSIEAAASRLAVKKKNRDFGDTDDLPSIVVIRCDEATPFKLLSVVIKSAQDVGYRNFALKAVDKRPGT